VNIERSGRRSRSRLHAVLSDENRLAIVDRLSLGDAAPSELAADAGMASNLLAHHLNALQSVGLVERARSEGDRRRIYVRLVPAVLETLTPSARQVSRPFRVAFVCSQNSARSQLAVLSWNRVSSVACTSAGTRPAARVHPKAVATARRHGLSLANACPRPARDVLRPGDLVVAVCDQAHEELVTWNLAGLHWSIPDPVRVGTVSAFERAFAEIDRRVGRLAAAIDPPADQESS
jgi:ArsR family transcriptional regulator, arsenate/arsenite/antimonite-responsive transcriptional repressor / arsenate reductase (thioredoxin)